MLLGSACVFSGVVVAQTPFNGAGLQASPDSGATVAGTPTIDLITVKSSRPGFPLRFGNVVPGSESVEFDGKTLKKGSDYQIDYPAGVLYLMRAQKPGQIVRIVYRYDKSKQASTVGQTQFSSTLPAFRFDLTSNGSMKAVIGFGLAERQADGNVLTSNVYGWQNATKNLNGLMLVGEREKADVQSGYEYTDKPGETPTGKSKFILQNFNAKVGGGTVEANYQDISSNFTSFSAVSSAGIDAAVTNQLAKEKGLKRFGFVVKDVKVGTAQISNGFRQVREGDASIQWKNFGFQTGGLKMSYTGQKVDPNFTRFGDLAEQDREQLRQEAGLSRQSFNASLGAVSFSMNDVEDGKGDGIYRRAVDFKTNAFDLNVSDQRVDSGFTRFGNLWEAEKGQWGREAGITRQNLTMNAALFGSAKQPVFRYSAMKNDGGKYVASDLNLASKTWSLQSVSRGSDKGFNQMGSMSEGEMDQNIRAIANMYGPSVPTNPNDRGAFLNGVGINRDWNKISGTFSKNWTANIERMQLSNGDDKIGTERFSLGGPTSSLSYSHQKTGEQFRDFSRLMEFERQRLSIISGLDRTDFSLNSKLSRRTDFAFSKLDVNTPEGGVKRNSVAIKDPKIEVAVNQRKVDKTFNQVSSLVDPEKDLLTALKGFTEQDVKLKWQLSPSLKLDLFTFDALNDDLGQSNRIRNFQFNWNPDKNTSIEAVRQGQEFRDPLQVLFANLTERISISRNFGRLGSLTYMNQTVDFDGVQNTSPDSKKQYVAYETKISPTTSVRTEQTRTQFENGDKENISANTISTELTKKAGVSLTDLKVDRNGEDRDEKRRNYGFWLDLGKGLKVSYGYVRQINGLQGTLNSNVQITPGTLDWFQLQNASYTENRWDGQNSQGLSNLAFQTARGLNLGLINDFKFAFSMDTATDRTNWVRENRTGGISGKIGSNNFSLDYRSQMHASGFRGIDRSFRFETDQSDKRAFRGHFYYTARQMPNDSVVMIRDLGFSYKNKNIELSHSLMTNPKTQQPYPDLPMFQITDPWRVSKWAMKWDMNPSNTLTGAYEERINDFTRENSRLAGVTFDLFKNSGSPLQLFWGLEQRWGNVERQTLQRFSIRYDQRPGPNQLLSLYVGNVSYQHMIAPGFKRNNLSLNVNYQLKF